jgi:hypothetical protein
VLEPAAGHVDFGASPRQGSRRGPAAAGENRKMKYILLIYGDERRWASLSKSDMEKLYADHRAYGAEMQKADVIRGGSELKPVSTATSIRFAGGKTRTVDGPFAETKEQLAGFYLIEVANLEEAITWAEKMPGMTEGTVEVRPLAVEA